MSIDKLEKAKEWLADRPSEALRLLPPAGSVPALVRPERYFVAAEAWRAMGYFQKAQALYGKLAGNALKREDPALWIEAALGCAAGLRSVGQVRAAYEKVKGAETISRKEGLNVYAERIRLERAMVDRASGKYARSIKTLSAMLACARRRKSLEEAAFLLWAIGGAQRFLGALAQSERSFLLSKKAAEKAGDRIGIGYALFGLGGVTRILGRLKEAAQYYKKAGGIFRGTDDDFAKAYAFCGYANALRQLGELREAERYYGFSHRIYSKLGDPVDLAYVDWGLGEVAKRLGRPAQALPLFKKSWDAFRKGGEDRGEILAGKSIAECLHALGKTNEAERRFAEAYRLAKKSGLHAHIEPYT